MLVTFDDGYRSVLEDGAPLLQERGIPAVAFVLTSLLGSDRPFWWVEVEALVCNGGTAGSGYDGAASGRATPTSYVRKLKTVSDQERRDVITRLRETASRPADPMPQLGSDELLALEAAGIDVGNHTVSHPVLHRCDDDTARSQVRGAHKSLTAVLGHVPRAFAYPNGNFDARAEQVLKEQAYQVAFLFDHRLTPTIPPTRCASRDCACRRQPAWTWFAAIVSGFIRRFTTPDWEADGDRVRNDVHGRGNPDGNRRRRIDRRHGPAGGRAARAGVAGAGPRPARDVVLLLAGLGPQLGGDRRAARRARGSASGATGPASSTPSWRWPRPGSGCIRARRSPYPPG